MSHLQAVCREWAAVRNASTAATSVPITGDSLTIADVVAVALYGAPAHLTADDTVRQRMNASVAFLAQELAAGKIIYGVNTGFGGSADTRTQNFHRLQSALVQHLNVGILLPSDKGQSGSSSSSSSSSQATTGSSGGGDDTVAQMAPARVDLLLRSHALPVAAVRALMLVRSNSLARGHSAVRVEVVEALLHLLTANMTPVVPLRGSISASGDLSTLSYVAGALEGNPDVYVRCEGSEPNLDPNCYLSADRALAKARLTPVRLQAKEGLGITNGTAPSCAVASLAVHTANQMAVWTQLLTAMGTEALAGTAHNYDDFISRVRPHGGQLDAAATIRRFLAGSSLAPAAGPSRVGLAQDRYALRTAPQWIGPQLEDLALATLQVATELNATTDNPLVDVAGGTVHHGGNFQAMSITSAMEKTMTALQNLGRLLYAQSAELVDSARNRGLPPNLSIDNPSTSFLCKGFDVNMAAYQAELAYLAHPVSGHVQVAEMANQSVNSMALVAARYALEAAEVVSLMAATYIFLVCQALDLRFLRNLFHRKAEAVINDAVKKLLLEKTDRESVPEATVGMAVTAVANKVLESWDVLAQLDRGPRAKAAARDVPGTLLEAIFPGHRPVSNNTVHVSGADLLTLQREVAMGLALAYETSCAYVIRERAPASAQLSPASRVVYEFVRLELRIPLHRGIDDHPPLAAERRQQAAAAAANGTANIEGHPTNGDNSESDAEEEEHGTRILGTMASEIYVALRDGRLFDRVAQFCEEAKPWEQGGQDSK